MAKAVSFTTTALATGSKLYKDHKAALDSEGSAEKLVKALQGTLDQPDIRDAWEKHPNVREALSALEKAASQYAEYASKVRRKLEAGGLLLRFKTTRYSEELQRHLSNVESHVRSVTAALASDKEKAAQQVQETSAPQQQDPPAEPNHKEIKVECIPENIPELSRLLTEPYRDRSDTESVPTTTTDTDIDTQRYAAESLATLAEKSRGVSTMVLASCDLPTLQTILSQCKDTGVLCAVVRILSRSNKVWSQKEDGPLFTELLRLTQMQHAELQGRAVKLLGTFAKYDMRFAIELDQSSAFKRLLWHQDAFVRTEAQRVMQGAQKVAR